MHFSVIVPLFNEQTNVRRVLAEIPASLATNLEVRSWELICVNDGSTDRTADELARGRTDQIVIVTLPRNLGKSGALSHGIRAARGEVVGLIDGDLQTSPADFGPLLAEMRTGNWDMVHGIRAQRHDGLVRRWSSRIANGVRRTVLGDDFADITCPLTVCRRTCLTDIPHFEPFHRYIPHLVRTQGYRVTQMPVRHFPRTADHAKYGVGNRLGVGITSLLAVRWLTRHTVPRRGGD
ncbi:MAG: glycosyltransferase family 2 protein [Gemmatimonadales bacterium]